MRTPLPFRYPDGWEVRFYRDGTYHRKRFPFAGHVDPEKTAQAFIDSVLDGAAPAAPVPPRLAREISEYQTYSEKVRQKSPAWCINQAQMLRVFATFAAEAGLKSMRQITARHARAYHEYYMTHAPFGRQANRHPDDRAKMNHTATWEKYRQVCSAFTNWCVRREIAPGNPWNDPEIRLKSQKAAIHVMTHEEITAIFEWVDRQDAAYRRDVGTLFLLLLYTGVRLSEARRLTWRDVDLSHGWIVITKSKSKETRTIPINSRLQTVLKPLRPRAGGLLFDQLRDDKYYWHQIKRIRDALSLPPIRIHDFRHTFAARLYQATRDLVTVQRLLGHSDIRMTKRYLDGFSVDLAAAIEQLEF